MKTTLKTHVAIFQILDFHYTFFNDVKALEDELKTATLFHKEMLEHKIWKNREIAEKLNLKPEGLNFKRILESAFIYVERKGRNKRLSKTTVATCLKRFVKLGFLEATKKGREKLYRIKDRAALVYHILGEIGDFRVVESLFWKTVKGKINGAFRAFWMALLQEEVKKAFRKIDTLKLSRRDIRFIELYEDYLFSKVPEGVSFEDYYMWEGETFHPPSVWLLFYMIHKYPDIQRLCFEGEINTEKPVLEGVFTYPALHEIPKLLKKYWIIHKEKEETLKGKTMKTKSVKMPGERFKLPLPNFTSCPNCGNNMLIWDYAFNEIICKKCGMVVYPFSEG